MTLIEFRDKLRAAVPEEIIIKHGKSATESTSKKRIIWTQTKREYKYAGNSPILSWFEGQLVYYTPDEWDEFPYELERSLTQMSVKFSNELAGVWGELLDDTGMYKWQYKISIHSSQYTIHN